MADHDAVMDRFDGNARRFRARDAIVATLVALVVLAVVKGSGMVGAGERLPEGVERSVIVGVGTLMFFADPSGNVFGAMQYDAKAE